MHGRILLVVVPLWMACAQSVKLDSPIDFESDDTPSAFDGVVQVHVETDGALTVSTTFTGYAGTKHGALTPELMNTLRGDIASVNFEDTPKVYECDHYSCTDSDRAFEFLSLSSNGQKYEFVVDRKIDNSQLPAPLVRLLDRLSSLSAQAD